MKIDIILSSMIFSLSLLLGSVSYLSEIGIWNMLVAFTLTWGIEGLLGKYKANTEIIDKAKHRSVFTNISFAGVGIVLILIIVALLVLLLNLLLEAHISYTTGIAVLVFLFIGGCMTIDMTNELLIHVGRIISYLVAILLIGMLFNIPYSLFEWHFGRLSVINFLRILPICLSHIFFHLYVGFKNTKEVIIGGVIGAIILVIFVLFVNSTLIGEGISSFLTSTTLVGIGSLTGRSDVLIICCIILIEAYRICVICNVLGMICISNNSRFVMILLMASVVIVALMSNLSIPLVETIIMFSGMLTALFAVII